MSSNGIYSSGISPALTFSFFNFLPYSTSRSRRLVEIRPQPQPDEGETMDRNQGFPGQGQLFEIIPVSDQEHYLGYRAPSGVEVDYKALNKVTNENECDLGTYRCWNLYFVSHYCVLSVVGIIWTIVSIQNILDTKRHMPGYTSSTMKNLDSKNGEEKKHISREQWITLGLTIGSIVHRTLSLLFALCSWYRETQIPRLVVQNIRKEKWDRWNRLWRTYILMMDLLLSAVFVGLLGGLHSEIVAIWVVPAGAIVLLLITMVVSRARDGQIHVIMARIHPSGC